MNFYSETPFRKELDSGVALPSKRGNPEFLISNCAILRGFQIQNFIIIKFKFKRLKGNGCKSASKD